MLAVNRTEIFILFMEENMKKILVSILLLAAMICTFALPAFATDLSFNTFSDAESDYIYRDVGSWDTGTYRNADGESYIIYEFPISEGDTHAQLSLRIRNQFKISATNTNPDNPNAYEVVVQAQPTEQEKADNVPHWADREAETITVCDLSKWCENNDEGYIYVMISDAAPENGWGPCIYKDTPITFWSGKTAAPDVEQPKTTEELAAEILAKYDFAEGDQYFMVDTEGENKFIYKAEGSWINEHHNRVHDNNSYTIYAFDVKASDTKAILSGAFNNQWVIRATMGDPNDLSSYVEIGAAQRTEAEIAEDAPWWGTRENPVVEVDLSSVLNGTDGKIYVYFGDCTTDTGWGGQVMFTRPVVFSTNAESAPNTADGAIVAATVMAIAAFGCVVISKKKH